MTDHKVESSWFQTLDFTRTMVGKVFIYIYLIPGLTLWFVLILNSSHKILCDSTIMIEKASNYTMNALNKSSELWHSISGRKARPYRSVSVKKTSSDHEFTHAPFKVCSSNFRSRTFLLLWLYYRFFEEFFSYCKFVIAKALKWDISSLCTSL